MRRQNGDIAGDVFGRTEPTVRVLYLGGRPLTFDPAAHQHFLGTAVLDHPGLEVSPKP